MPGFTRSFAPRILISTGIVAALASAAGAQIPVFRLGIPDFDQRRTGLVGNGGMHCVPTSCMNLYAYASNNGIPAATNPFPGPRNWSTAANYDEATQLIQTLGNLMGTTAANGTSGSGAETGMFFYNLGFAQGKFTSDVYWANGFFAPGPATVSNHMLLGGLVAVCYGRYTLSGGVWTRGGGHCMSLVGVQNPGSTPSFYVRDPAADEGDVAGRLTNQSPFRTEIYTMIPTPGNFRYAGQNGSNFRVMHQFLEKGTGRFLDTIMVIWPQMCITPVSIGDIPHVRFIVPFSLTAGAQPTHFDVPVGGGITQIHDAAIGLDKSEVFFTAQLTRTTGGLYRHDRLTDAVEQIVPGGSFGKLVVDRHGRPIVRNGNTLMIIAVNPGGDPEVQTITPPIPPEEFFYDDTTDELHVLSVSEDRIAVLLGDGSVRSNRRLPPGLDLQGDGSVVPAPDGLHVWVADSSSGNIYELLPAAGAPVFTLTRTLLLPAVQSIRSMQFDDQGHLFISNGTDMHEFQPSAAGGGWVPTPNSLWSGRATGPSINLGRSRTNYLPEVMGPGDVNILNGEPGNGGSLPDCQIDINFDGFVDPDDLADYVTMFFLPRGRFFDPRIDYNADSFVDPDDLADYITDFFLQNCG